MKKELCPFGQLLRAKRKEQGISLWTLSVNLPYPQGNIQRIERGLHEPRLGLAIRLITALGLNAGYVLDELARQEGLLQEEGIVAGCDSTLSKMLPPNDQEIAICLFGPLLRERRLAHEIPQRRVAENAGYTLRNLINVEKGTQEPGVMTALKLAIATGDSPCSFFGFLQKQMQG